VAGQVRVCASPVGRDGPILLEVGDYHWVFTANSAYTVGRMLIDAVGGQRSVTEATELHLLAPPSAGQQD
jgi:hypothetical protein